MAWRVYAAASIGKSHIDAGTPCQDAFAHRVQGDVLVACVCDGAGSQSLSQEGAQFASRDIVERLTAALALDPGLVHADAATATPAVAAIVAQTRAGLESRANSEGVPLASFSATVVGAVIGPAGGFFFHIGDGVCVASTLDPAVAEIVSLPENGEYINETYFITGEEWQAHLRLDAFAAQVATVALMSDGADPFVMAKGNGGLYRPFMDPVLKYLATVDEAEGSKALESTLGDPRTYGITGDDKSLLVAMWS
jgi:hypothetical protein